MLDESLEVDSSLAVAVPLAVHLLEVLSAAAALPSLLHQLEVLSVAVALPLTRWVLLARRPAL